jgi:hypothetical protein
MLIRIGDDIRFEIGQPVSIIALLSVHPSRRADLKAPGGVARLGAGEGGLDWVHSNVTFSYPHASPTRTALEVYNPADRRLPRFSGSGHHVLPRSEHSGPRCDGVPREAPARMTDRGCSFTTSRTDGKFRCGG